MIRLILIIILIAVAIAYICRATNTNMGDMEKAVDGAYRAAKKFIEGAKSKKEEIPSPSTQRNTDSTKQIDGHKTHKATDPREREQQDYTRFYEQMSRKLHKVSEILGDSHGKR